MDLQKLRLGLAGLALLIAVLTVVLYFDFSDLSWSANRSNYIGIITMLLLSISMIFSYRHAAKKGE